MPWLPALSRWPGRERSTQDLAVAASFIGDPTDIASGDGLVAVIDGTSSGSHLSIFSGDEDGNLILKNPITIPGAINGVAVVRGHD